MVSHGAVCPTQQQFAGRSHLLSERLAIYTESIEMSKPEKVKEAMDQMETNLQERQRNATQKPIPQSSGNQLANRTGNSAVLPTRNANLPEAGTFLADFDTATWQGRAMLIAATGAQDYHIPEGGCATITAIHYVIFRDTVQNRETGEFNECARTVLIDKAGKTFKTTAEHGPQVIETALRLFKPEEWAAGIPFEISEHFSPKTRRTSHKIRVSMSQPCQPNS
jgi:hypothetical protein